MLLLSRKSKLTILAACVLSLTACSTLGKKTPGDSSAEIADANSLGATSSGIGSDNNFAGQVKLAGNAVQVGDQTYYFDFDKSFVRDSDRPSIEAQARYLANHPKAKMLVEGNTDPRGSREYNIALGERRGNSIADVLKLQGAGKDQLRIVSYGAEKLATTGTTEEDYQLDRRVHIVYEDKG